ncbi:MAG: cytochrome c biogenesis CcdA family protein [Halobacteriota archaeon]
MNLAGEGVAAASGLAAGAGVVTFFSPCAYALLPSYVGYYVSSVEQPGLRGALTRGVAASLGVLTSFAGLSIVAVAVGDALRPYLTAFEYLVGGALVVLGLLVLLDVSADRHFSLPRRRASIPGFFGFGVAYALAAAGCVAPVFLGVVIGAMRFTTPGGVAVLTSYALSFAVLMLGFTVAVAVGQDVGSERLAGYRGVAVRVAGAVLVVAGLLQIVYVARLASA